MRETSVLSVSDALDVLNDTLAAAVPALIVEGEVSGFSVNRGKFVFFDLKDEEASLPCFMMAFNLRFPLQDGMKVRLLATPSITAKGRFSMTVRELQPVGEGSLKKAYEILKKKLEAEGLFAPERKRVLPEFPKRIAVVSSSGAAGWADFTKILNERWGGLEVSLADVSVQGLSAPAEVIKAIEYFNQQSELADLLVIIRGGGSADDLAVFSHEDVVRAVSASRIPTVVGVGHETDESLAELAADLRASTPSNAAQLIIPDKKDLLERLTSGRAALLTRLSDAIEDWQNEVSTNRQALSTYLSHFLKSTQQQVGHHLELIRQFSPEAALQRGYGVVKGENGIISSVKNVRIGERIQVSLKDGTLGATVNDKRQSHL